jgi:hypothetical protein
LRYGDLSNEGRGYVFPCDGGGHVDIDELNFRSRQNYFYARMVVGKEFALPVVGIAPSRTDE